MEKKAKLDILDCASSDSKYPDNAISCVESVIAELSSSHIEGIPSNTNS